MVDKWNITIPELTGKEERRAYVYLPESYFKSTRKRYPVLYMFDGHNVFFDEDATFGKCWGMKEFMDSSERSRDTGKSQWNGWSAASKRKLTEGFGPCRTESIRLSAAAPWAG